jgi:hypothetical protein
MYSTALQTRCWPIAPRPERPRRRSASAPAERLKGSHLYSSQWMNPAGSTPLARRMKIARSCFLWRTTFYPRVTMIQVTHRKWHSAERVWFTFVHTAGKLGATLFSWTPPDAKCRLKSPPLPANDTHRNGMFPAPYCPVITTQGTSDFFQRVPSGESSWSTTDTGESRE